MDKTLYFIAFTLEEAKSIYSESTNENVLSKIWNQFMSGSCPACKEWIHGKDPYCGKCGFNIRMYALKHGFKDVFDGPNREKNLGNCIFCKDVVYKLEDWALAHGSYHVCHRKCLNEYEGRAAQI